MNIELEELMTGLQGQWKLDNEDLFFEINGNEINVSSNSKTVKSSFQLVRNMQLGNWQIKVMKPMSWLRTFIVQITQDTFMVYDFDLTVNIAMAGRTKLLNPTRIYKYTRVAVPVT